MLPPADLRAAIRQVRAAAPDRSVAVNLLVPFVRRSHVQACVESVAVAPTIGMPERAVERTALYAGETVLRMTSAVSARQAVTDLAPR